MTSEQPNAEGNQVVRDFMGDPWFPPSQFDSKIYLFDASWTWFIQAWSKFKRDMLDVVYTEHRGFFYHTNKKIMFCIETNHIDIAFKYLVGMIEMLKMVTEIKGMLADGGVHSPITLMTDEDLLPNFDLTSLDCISMPEVTRVEVIDKTGRAYVNMDVKGGAQLDIQDDKKTLKIFLG